MYVTKYQKYYILYTFIVNSNFVLNFHQNILKHTKLYKKLLLKLQRILEFNSYGSLKQHNELKN